MVNEHDFDNLLPLTDISEMLEGVSHRQLLRWAENGRDNGFPEPAEVLGKFKLYDRDAVLKWVYLWKKVNKNWVRAYKDGGGIGNG